MTEPAEDVRIRTMEEAARIVESWDRPSVLRLHAGEMSAQEMRTARAVLRGVAAAIRDRSLTVARSDDPIVHPMWAEKGADFVIGYMCLVDFECELGGAAGGNGVHPSVEDLRRSHRCVDACGIVEVRVQATRIVQAPSYDLDDEPTAAVDEPETSTSDGSTARSPDP